MKRIQILIYSALLGAGGLYASEDPRAISITVSTNGLYAIYNTESESSSVTREKLSSILNLRYQKYGKHPFVLRPDSNTVFGDIWPVIETAAKSGLWSQTLYDGTNIVSVSIPSREGEKLSPVVLKGFKGNSITKGALVNITRDGILIANKRISLATFRQQFQRLGAVSDSVSILILVSDSAPTKSLLDALRILNETGNKNLCLAREDKMHNKRIHATN